VSDDLIELLDALHVWPQSVASEYADVLTRRQIEKLYAIGYVATEAAAEIRSLREQVAQAEHRARLEGMEIMLEAAEQAVEDAKDTDWDDCCLDVMCDALQAIQNLDLAAILAEHTRAKDEV